jgi:hypothetical protein
MGQNRAPLGRGFLMVFRKTRMREDRDGERARRALERCVTERHTVIEGAER